MSHYEWEVARVPRTVRPVIVGTYHPRPHAITEYLSLEYPRESAAWILSSHARSQERAGERKAGAEP